MVINVDEKWANIKKALKEATNEHLTPYERKYKKSMTNEILTLMYERRSYKIKDTHIYKNS